MPMMAVALLAFFAAVNHSVGSSTSPNVGQNLTCADRRCSSRSNPRGSTTGTRARCCPGAVAIPGTPATPATDGVPDHGRPPDVARPTVSGPQHGQAVPGRRGVAHHHDDGGRRERLRVTNLELPKSYPVRILEQWGTVQNKKSYENKGFGVRGGGLEPPYLSTPDPKSGASTSSAIPAS